MPLPNITETIQDFALGLGADPNATITALIGTSSTGTANTIYSFSEVKALKDTLGTGPLVEAAAAKLEKSKSPVLCVPVTASTAGSSTSVTLTGTGPNPGVTVSSGTPRDAYQVRVKIVVGGTVGTATFSYSLDGGDNYSPTKTSASTYVLEDTGLTLGFTAGTYVAGDLYSFDCTAPTYSSADLNTALDNLIADPRTWRHVQIVGTVGGANDNTKVTNLVALATAVGTKLDAAQTAHRFSYAILEIPDVTDAAISSVSNGIPGFAHSRVALTGGFCEMISHISGRAYKRPMGWAIAARIAAVSLSEDPGYVGRGALSGIVSLYRNEEAIPLLHDLRIMTLRTVSGIQGFYVTQGRMMAATGSDFSLLVNRQVMDLACRIARQALLPYVNGKVRVDVTTGFILEAEALGIEAVVGGQLRSALIPNNHALAVYVTIKRDNNILSTGQLITNVRLVTNTIASSIDLTLGFLNPALLAAAAA